MAERGDGRCDALIIGGGHNGLVCAAYLAQAGLKVTVLERRDVVGGAAVTEEFHPGFRNSVAAYTVSLLNPKVIKDLDLHAHGLRIVERRAANFLPTEDGRYLLSGGERTHDEVARFSARDAARLAEYGQRLESIADVHARPGADDPAERAGGQLAPGAAGAGERGAGGRPPAQARHGPAARIAVAVLDVLRGLSRQLVRERPDQGHLRLRRCRRQLREPLQSRLRLCTAAPRIWRGEWQARRLGARHRRHGGDHPGDGQGCGRARRGDPRGHRRARGARRRRPRRRGRHRLRRDPARRRR